MAGEFKRKGATLSLGPAVLGPLGKIPHGGRNWEGFGVDPYLSGILGAESVRATQDEGIISCTKVNTHIILTMWVYLTDSLALCWERARNTPISEHRSHKQPYDRGIVVQH